MNYVIQALKSFDISTATNDMKNDFLDGAQQYFQEVDKAQIIDVESDLPRKRKLLGKEQQIVPDDEEEELMEFINLKDDIESDKQYLYHKQGLRRDTYVNTSGDASMLDKVYVRKSSEQSKSAYDYKINVLNVIGIPDLFNEIISRRSGRSDISFELSLKEIIDYLYFVKKVNEIIIFDFSCSSFADAVTHEPVFDERLIRIERKNLLKERLHGGTIKRRTRHKKKKHARNTNKKKHIFRRYSKTKRVR
jgi:hypothetical protein